MSFLSVIGDGGLLDAEELPCGDGRSPDGCLDLKILSGLERVLGVWESSVASLVTVDPWMVERVGKLLIVEFETGLGLPFVSFVELVFPVTVGQFLPTLSTTLEAEDEKGPSFSISPVLRKIFLTTAPEAELERGSSFSISPVLRRIFLSNRFT